jgi:hypothetical protein
MLVGSACSLPGAGFLSRICCEPIAAGVDHGRLGARLHAACCSTAGSVFAAVLLSVPRMLQVFCILLSMMCWFVWSCYGLVQMMIFMVWHVIVHRPYSRKEFEPITYFTVLITIWACMCSTDNVLQFV